MGKYIIFVNTEFYPYVYEEYDDLELARSAFGRMEPYDEDMYLCEIIEKRSDIQPPTAPVENLFDLLPKEPWSPQNSTPTASKDNEEL